MITYKTFTVTRLGDGRDSPDTTETMGAGELWDCFCGRGTVEEVAESGRQSGQSLADWAECEAAECIQCASEQRGPGAIEVSEEDLTYSIIAVIEIEAEKARKDGDTSPWIAWALGTTPQQALVGYVACGEAVLGTLRLSTLAECTDLVERAGLDADGLGPVASLVVAADEAGSARVYDDEAETVLDVSHLRAVLASLPAPCTSEQAWAALAEAESREGEADRVGGSVRWHRPTRRPVVAVKVAGRWCYRP